MIILCGNCKCEMVLDGVTDSKDHRLISYWHCPKCQDVVSHDGRTLLNLASKKDAKGRSVFSLRHSKERTDISSQRVLLRQRKDGESTNYASSIKRVRGDKET